MALPAVLMSMITVTNTAVGVLGIIKRRCGASMTIKDLVSKSVQLVEKVRELLETMENGVQMPQNTRRIVTALNQRQEEFDSILKTLVKIKRRTERTHPADRTERFIKAQGWCEKMEAVHTDLVHVRNGIENIIANWDAANFVVMKVEEMVTIDVTEKKESGRQAERKGQNADCNIMGSTCLNYVDRIQMTMVTLTDAAKSALNEHGDLENLSLPDGMYQAFHRISEVTTRNQLLQASAELLHPAANYDLGVCYKFGYYGLVQSLDSALHHFRVSSSRGSVDSMVKLMEHYNNVNDRKRVLKYFKMATNYPMTLYVWQSCAQFATANNLESTQLVQPLIDANHYESAWQQSICYFFGFGVPKCNKKALHAILPIDSDSYSVEFYDIEKKYVDIDHSGYVWGERFISSTTFRNYAEFLFKSNQFLPWLLFSSLHGIYSTRRWASYAFQAANSQCVDAHLLLAYHFSWGKYRNEHYMKRHLRIAACAGHLQAQYACRKMFGMRESFPKSLRLIEERRPRKREKQVKKPREKRFEETKAGSREKRNDSASKKRSARET